MDQFCDRLTGRSQVKQSLINMRALKKSQVKPAPTVKPVQDTKLIVYSDKVYERLLQEQGGIASKHSTKLNDQQKTLTLAGAQSQSVVDGVLAQLSSASKINRIFLDNTNFDDQSLSNLLK